MYVFTLAVLASILVFMYMFWKHPIETMVVYDVDIDATPININSSGFDLSEKAIAKLLQVPFLTLNRQKDSLYLIDSLSMPSNHKMLTVVDDEKAFFIMKKRDGVRYETLRGTKKKKIGVPSSSHKRVFELVCRACGIDVSLFEYVETNNLLDCDALLYFESLNNTKKIYNLDIDFIDYEQYDIHKLKHLMPYCKVKTTPLNTYFTDYRDKYPIKTYIAFDFILAGPPEISRFPGAKFGKEAETNFLKMYLDFYELYEHFQDMEEIRAKSNVDGVLLNGIFTMKNDTIDGIPVKAGMKIVMENQDRKIENGIFKSIGDQKLEKRRAKIYDIDYECIEYPEIKTKDQCPGTWDRRCQTHEECPFFQANKTYTNYFGGCIDGYCHMPIGVERVGFRQYKSSPECHDVACKDIAFPLDVFDRQAFL